MSASRNTCPARTAAGTAAGSSGTAACPAAAACVLDDAWAVDRASAAAVASIVPAGCPSAVGTSAAAVGLSPASVSACSFRARSASSAAVAGPCFCVSAATAGSVTNVPVLGASMADVAKEGTSSGMDGLESESCSRCLRACIRFSQKSTMSSSCSAGARTSGGL